MDAGVRGAGSNHMAIPSGAAVGAPAVRKLGGRRFACQTGAMTAPSPDSPNDQFNPENFDLADTTGATWNNPYQPTSDRTPVPYAGPSGVPAPTSSPSPAELDRQAAERRAITMRIVTALVLAVPLTAIAGGIMGGGVSSLLGMALAWAGIALVVYLSHGKGFPFPRS